MTTTIPTHYGVGALIHKMTHNDSIPFGIAEEECFWAYTKHMAVSGKASKPL